MPTITPDVQAALYHETDVRFAAKYGIARKLDPKSPADQKWIPLWILMYQAVKHEWEQGPIAWMSQHPAVAAAHAQAQAFQATQPPQVVSAHDAAMFVAATQPARQFEIGPAVITPHVQSGPPPSAVPIDPYTSPIPGPVQATAADMLNRAAAAHAAQANISPPGMTPPMPAAHVDPGLAHAQAVANAASNLAHASAQQPPPPHDGYATPAPPPSTNTGRIVLGISIATAFLGGVALLNHKASKRPRRRARVAR